jgi:CMP-N-acetylneuraminic acid synthetase
VGRSEERPKLVAFVPMRHESQRVPGKNYRILAGRPLYFYVLETLQSCPEVEQIVVDTDSPQIHKGVKENFPEVVLLERPDHLRDGNVPMNEVLLHDAGLVEAAFYLQTHSTNPLLRADTVRRAISRFFEAYPRHDSLFSVTRLQQRLWDARVQPVNHDPTVLIRTQDLPPMYVENSCLYLFEREGFLERRNRIGRTPMLFEIAAEEAWDIDNEIDFRLAECLLGERGG